MKKLLIVSILTLGAVGLTFFVFKNNSQKQNITKQQVPLPQTETLTTDSTCKEESVAIEGNGDKGKRLKSCFVEYPGEPSRQDKSYYIVEDICGQFTKDFVSNALGKEIIKTVSPNISTLYNCEYHYSDKNEYVLIVLDFLTIENQRIGQEAMGRRTEESSKIPMKNMIVWQENGLLNSIYLILSDSKFIRIDRSAESKLTADELINFAANVSREVKNYK